MAILLANLIVGKYACLAIETVGQFDHLPHVVPYTVPAHHTDPVAMQ